MSWKEGKDLYLVILFLGGIALAEGVLFTLGRDRSEREAAREAAAGDRGVPQEGVTVASVMASSPDDSLYARVTGPRPFVFPDDHGPHPRYRTEWWYVTGNMESDEGRPLGFQFTLFRSAVAPVPPATRSAWGTNQVYLGHLAVVDRAEGVHHHAERFARGAAGLAGARAAPFRVWLEGWELSSDAAREADPAAGTRSPDDPDAIFPLRLRAEDDSLALDLVLEPGKGIVLQGDRGYSRKGSQEGNASHYFSYPRMPSRGTIRVGDRVHRVTGLSWMDREWSTSALEEGQAGWDWFALQFSNDSELMVYQLRDAEGRPDTLGRGTRVAQDGTTRALTVRDWSLEVLDEWTSPLDGARYPSRWRLRVPSEQIDVEVVPMAPDQEMDVTVRYWEGAVTVSGTVDGRPGGGRGYVELTGYADRSAETTEGVRARGN